MPFAECLRQHLKDHRKEHWEHHRKEHWKHHRKEHLKHHRRDQAKPLALHPPSAAWSSAGPDGPSSAAFSWTGCFEGPEIVRGSAIITIMRLEYVTNVFLTYKQGPTRMTEADEARSKNPVPRRSCPWPSDCQF